MVTGSIQMQKHIKQMDTFLTENKKIMFTDNTNSFGLKIKLNDFHRYASSSSLNISFEIEFELFQILLILIKNF